MLSELTHLNPVAFPQITGVRIYFLNQQRGQTDVLLFAKLAPNPKSLNWSLTTSVVIDPVPEGEGNAILPRTTFL